MFLSTVISTSLLALGAFALPSSIKARDTCQHIYDPLLNYISSASPTTSIPQSTSPFYLYQSGGNKYDLVATFKNIPATAYGCTLQFDYEPNSQTVFYDAAGDVARIDVYAINNGGNFPNPITWATTAARTGSLVGTFNFPSGAALNTPQTIFINSFVCNPVLAYRFTISDPNANGGVWYPAEGLTAGLRMAYSC